MKVLRIHILIVIILAFTISANAVSPVSEWYTNNLITPPRPIVKLDITEVNQKIDAQSLIMTINYQIQNELKYINNTEKENLTKLLYDNSLSLYFQEEVTTTHEEGCYNYKNKKVSIPKSDILSSNGTIAYGLISKKIVATLLVESIKTYAPDTSEEYLTKICEEHSQSYDQSLLDEYRSTFEGLNKYTTSYNNIEEKAFFFHGNWETDYGSMRITKLDFNKTINNSLNDCLHINFEGIYSKPSDKKKIYGRLIKKNNQIVLDGQWDATLNNKKGAFSFTLSDDQLSFSGFCTDKNGLNYPWNGTRVTLKEEAFFGAWNLNGKEVLIHQGIENALEGQFNSGRIKLKGDLAEEEKEDEYVIKGSWIEVATGKERGKIEFIYDPENKNELIFKRLSGDDLKDWREFTLTRIE